MIRTSGLRFTRTVLCRLSHASENDQTDDGAGGDRRGLGVAPIASTAPSSNIWTFTMRNSPASKRQIEQETSQTHDHRIGVRSVTDGPVPGRGATSTSRGTPAR